MVGSSVLQDLSVEIHNSTPSEICNSLLSLNRMVHMMMDDASYLMVHLFFLNGTWNNGVS